MSPFKTVIPIDLNAVKALLPPKSYIVGVTWNPEKQQLEMEWGHQELVHPLTIPVEFTVEQLKAKKLPSNVRRRDEVTVEHVEKKLNDRLEQRMAEAPKPQPLKCASCGKAIHWDGLSSYVHSDGKKYRHPCTPKKEMLTPPDTLSENKATLNNDE